MRKTQHFNMVEVIIAFGRRNDEILRLNREYTFFSWSAQAKINPIVIDRADGIYFWGSLRLRRQSEANRHPAQYVVDLAHQASPCSFIWRRHSSKCTIGVAQM